ncbi:fungal-specific transcription factor domain-containing protein [Hygrophoropsis aurantiaca]|uniref:Fungal-specific transcription factor domain-containing protein n=1 Tax=Hygrophoropsis aurantiaca TaxID=72124 RepID=A0ACB8AFI1_9AGAM|nr:fungal-specific transcription factor domain-containing protein [Hygrophoropsis aurantiaca]
MTHILAPHTDLNLAASSLHSALHMDPNQQQQQLQQPNQPPHQQAPQQSRKRSRKTESNSDDAGSPSEPRRLRRSHEACARCRSKKIKCDSKHPKCTACATANVPCQQEDRHRQTLTPRGHTEFIERQINLCEALLKRHIAGFSLNNLEDICAREGIELDGNPPEYAHPPGQPFPQQPPGAPHPGTQYYPPHMLPGYSPHGVPINYGPYPPPHMIPGPVAYGPNIHPGFPPQPPSQPMQPGPQMSTPLPQSANIEVKELNGTDPLSLDMASTQGLAKSFGVNPVIVGNTQMTTVVDKEDLAVGSNGLLSRRGDNITAASLPRDASKWFATSAARTQGGGAPSPTESAVKVWLPKDRQMVGKIVDAYFARLNLHRPVFFRDDFENKLNALYNGENMPHDSGYLCSMYLILALGTLSELNHRASDTDKDRQRSTDLPIGTKSLLQTDWPEHEEFFERALAVKPDLRVTISSLQALILLQWYLYTERQGRSLWRLVGSLVRLSIELGLHHDPTAQANTFTEEECQLRIRLWGIVMVHDRGTSILLGRPLAIAPYDSNTPHPARAVNGQYSDFSEHFLLSHPIAEIQADIINSLYAPARQGADTVMRHATRIIKSMLEFRRHLPDSYKWYFGGTEDWPLEKRQDLVRDITEDQGLTLLKFGIARILLLRALFSMKELEYSHRVKALVDAIVTSHNIIIVHNQLIKFPDIAFFVSPIPLHIAAMVILYGHMSDCKRLPHQVMVEDVWMALDMLPRFRWRWERKDVNGGHPLISKLAEKVLNVNLHSVGPTKDPVLLSELDWETDTSVGLLSSPSLANQSQMQIQQKAPNVLHQPYPNMPPGAYGPPQRGTSTNTTPVKGPNGSTVMGGTHTDKLVDIPTGLFYPFFPENPMGSIGASQMSGPSSDGGSAHGDGNNGSQDYSQILAAAAAAQPNGSYGHSSADAYMLEETVPTPTNPGMWMNMQNRGIQFMSS